MLLLLLQLMLLRLMLLQLILLLVLLDLLPEPAQTRERAFRDAFLA